MPSGEEGHLVRVWWRDAASESSWVRVRDIGPPLLVSTVGWVLVDNAEQMILAGTRPEIHEEEPEYNQVIAIPKSWTDKIKRLEE